MTVVLQGRHVFHRDSVNTWTLWDGLRLRRADDAGGSPNGATTIAGGDGSRHVPQIELDGARYQGRRIAEVAAKLHV